MTKTVKVVTNVNEVVVFFINFRRNTTYNRNGSRNITEVYYYVRLLESKSEIALTRLNSISDEIFASNVSMFMGGPVTLETKRKWFIYDVPNEKDYGDTYLSESPLSTYKRILFYSCASIHQSMMVLCETLCYILQFSI